MFSLRFYSKGWPHAVRMPGRVSLLKLSLCASLNLLLPGDGWALASAEITAATPTTTRLSLAQALQAARLTMPELALARSELAASEAQLQQAQSRPNPEFSYSLEDWRGQNQSRSLQLSLPVETAQKRELRIAAANAGQAQARADVQLAWSVSRSQVSQAYFDALLAQRQLSLAQAALDLAQLFTQSVQQRIRAGKLAAAELHKAKVAENSVQLERLQASQQQQLSRLHLQSLIARSDWSELDDSSLDLPELSELSVLHDQLLRSAQLQKAQLEVQKRRSLSELERRKRLPDLSVSLGIKQNRDSTGQQVLLGVSLPLPLFDTNAGNIAEAQQREQKAADELRLLQRQLRDELSQNHARYRNLQQQAELLKTQILHDAELAYQAARLGFSHGKFSFLEVLDAQRSLFSQQALYLKTLAEGHKLYFDIQRISGDQLTLNLP